MAAGDQRVHWTQVDGVPCVWMQDGYRDLTVCLLARVGSADETVRTAGLTHLVEHLALPTGPVPRIDFNGTVDLLTTVLWTEGEPDSAVAAITETGARLADPPRARIPLERRILRAEAETRSPDNWRSSLALRYGPVRHGLLAYRELGVAAATDDDVVRWSRTRFTRENCVLYMTGRPPRGMRLPLRSGAQYTVPSPRPISYVEYPSAYPYGPSGGIALSLVGERSYEFNRALRIAARRLSEQLRNRAGTTYGVDLRHELLDAGLSYALISADCEEEYVRATRDAMLGVLEELALIGPTEEELEADLDASLRASSDPANAAGELWRRARRHLLGIPMETFAQGRRLRERITARGVAAALEAALPTMLLILPYGSAVPGGRFRMYPVEPPFVPAGKSFRRRIRDQENRHERLVVGPDGVAVRREKGSSAVPFDRCIGIERYPDGTRSLWSDDGFFVYVDPAEWRGGAAAVQVIDSCSPPESWIDVVATASPLGDELQALVETTDWLRQIEQLRAVVERDPDNGDAWGYLAHALDNAGYPGQALDAAERACSIAPLDAWAHELRSRALLHLERFSDAAEAIREAVRLDPAGCNTLSDAAWILGKADEHELARRYAERAVELHPESGEAWFAQATVLERAGDLAGAEAAYRHALELEPEVSMWHNNLGSILLLRERYEEAAPHLERAIELDKTNDTARINLAASYGLRGDLGRARRLLRAVRARRIDEIEADLAAGAGAQRDLYRELSRLLQSGGRHAEALQAARRILERAPEDCDGLERALSSALSANALDEARGYLERLAAHGDLGDTHCVAVAWAGALLGQRRTAADYARLVARRNATAVLRNLADGYAAFAGDDWATARARFEAVLEEDAVNCCAQTWLGRSEAEAGDLGAADRSYRRAEALAICECPARLLLRATVA